MADLVEHYLLQLRSLLPARQRDDIANELGESIRGTVAERERELGRVLSDDEVAGVLKGYGHPVLVAGRYLPIQELIGPRLFPLYWYALQGVVIVIAVVTGTLAGIAFLTGARTGMQVLMNGFWFALMAAAGVTISFAVLDHCSARLKMFEDFDPRKFELGVLGVRAAPLSPIPRADTVFEIATLVVFIAWWVGWIVFTPVLGAGDLIRFSDAIEPYFWPLLTLAVVDLVRLAIDFVYPYRTWPRVLARLAVNVAWLVALVLVFRADDLITVVPADGSADGALTIARYVFKTTVGVLAVVTATLIATDVVRLLRR